MKPLKIFLFIALVFLSLGIIGFVVPQDGINIGSFTLRFPSPLSVFAPKDSSAVDIEKNLADLKHQADLSQIQEMGDSLSFFKEFIYYNKARIHLPNNDYAFLDTFFQLLDSAKTAEQAIQIFHYGDSQIEMDRISSNLRQTLQERFSGEGAGIIPAIQTIPTFSVAQSYSGNLSRYAVYGDTTNIRSSHRRYGILAAFSQLDGNATITATGSKSRKAQPGVAFFSRVKLLLGNNAAGFSAKCNNTIQSVKQANKGVSTLTWDFDEPISRASLSLSGRAEIYGISLEGKSGVTVTNVPMRGSSGTVFTRIDSTILAQSYEQMNVKMIILQYGGNMMPQINGEKSISRYMKMIASQMNYLKSTNPNALMMFIGPADMAKRIDGKMQTYPYLPAMNDSLKNTVLANNGIYWDTFNVMGGENSMSAWVKHSPAWASTDYIHFTDAGAREIANALSEAFMVHYQFYDLRKTCNPDLVKKFMTEQ